MGSAIVSFLGGLVAPVFGWLGKREDTKQAEVAQATTKEQDTHGEQSDASSEFKAEQVAAAAAVNRSWWDSFVDGLNRLPRPMMALMIIGILVYCPLDPERFAIVMTSYNLMPLWMTGIIAQVILLFFGGRALADKLNAGMSIDPKVIKSTLDQIHELRGQVKARDDAAKAPPTIAPPTAAQLLQQSDAKPIVPDVAFKAAMADTSKPLGNAEIAEWNRRRSAPS